MDSTLWGRWRLGSQQMDSLVRCLDFNAHPVQVSISNSRGVSLYEDLLVMRTVQRICRASHRPDSRVLFLLKIDLFIYLCMIDRERERGRDTGGGRSRLHAQRLTWDSILGFQDHALGQRQVPNRCATHGSQKLTFFEQIIPFTEIKLI